MNTRPACCSVFRLNNAIVFISTLTFALTSALAGTTEEDFLRAREKRDQAIAAASAPINDMYRTTLQELLRRAQSGGDKKTARQIQYELQRLPAASEATNKKETKGVHPADAALNKVHEKLADTKWRVSPEKTFVLRADGTSTSSWTPRQGWWRVVSSNVVELSIANIPKTAKVTVEEEGTVLVWQNKEPDQQHPEVAKKIGRAE